MARYQPRRSSARWLDGAPAYVLACYDNGARIVDRYTVLYGAPFWTPDMGRTVPYFAASADPFAPLGFGQHGEMPAHNRAALGRKVKWADLPADVRRAVIQDGEDELPRIVHQGRRTYWETAPGVYQATASPETLPAPNGAGYRDLAALCRLKGDTPPAAAKESRR